jgi:transposase
MNASYPPMQMVLVGMFPQGLMTWKRQHWKIIERFSRAKRRKYAMKLTAVGIDIAKNIFQLHHMDEKTREIVSKPIKRAKFLAYFANRAPCLIGMEACGGAHHWARQLMARGHQVRLMSARFVKAFNVRNKNDAADARALWLAVQQPGKGAAVNEMQQTMLSLHRMRAQLVKFRIMQSNDLRGLLAEYGEVTGRGFAAWVGLVPKQTGTGGKAHLQRGDTYLRTLLIHGASSVLTHAKEPVAWVERMKKRRPLNVVIVALANRMARMLWAVLAHGRAYQKEYVSARPA